MTGATWSFHAFDTWFFRESRPHGTTSGLGLSSVFPPPAQTVAGAIRFIMGEKLGVDWQAFGRGEGRVGPIDLRQEIGFGDDLGRLQLQGPWLVCTSEDGHRERLYPAPGFLLTRRKAVKKKGRIDIEHEPVRLPLGPAFDCDLGRVRLPLMPTFDDGVRAKALESTWLTAEGLDRVLGGLEPHAEHLVDLTELSPREPRLGIARDNAARTHLDGMLYQTHHIRPMEGLSIEVDIEGVAEELLDPLPYVRLGSEGRMTSISKLDTASSFPAAPEPDENSRGLILCLLTPADFNGGWLPPGFTPQATESGTRWEGSLCGIDLEIHAAILGRAIREGGWDLAHRRPREVRSLVPAGSAFYCTIKDGTVKGSLTDAIQALHGSLVGRDNTRNLGRGRLAVALWPSSEDIQDEKGLD